MRTLAPPVWFFGCVVAMQRLHVIAPGALWSAPSQTLVGVVPVGAGVALYGWIRHPMYLAGVPILCVVILLLG